jgi:hypothetical protein
MPISRFYVTGVLGLRRESGALDGRRLIVKLCAILKRIKGGIVGPDPHPQYSALDRMDGLDSVCLKSTPKASWPGRVSQPGSTRGDCGSDPTTGVDQK